MTKQATTVLVVDDNADDRRIYAALLEHYGFRALTATDGLEGIRVALDELPDLIIMDLMMPGISGLYAVEVLKSMEETRDIPVVAISHYDWREDEVKSAGSDSYLPKPFGSQALLSEMNRLLDRAA